MPDEPKKKRGRPAKAKPPSEITSSVENKHEVDASITEKRVYDFVRLFKKIDVGNAFIDQRIQNYTYEDIEKLLDNPISNQSQLVSLNNFAYLKHGFFKELLEFLVKPILHRWSIETKAINFNYKKVKPEKLEKDFITYANRVSQLNLETQLHRLLLKSLIEDCVCAYWLDGDDVSTLFYFPQTWCVIKAETNGIWTYRINTARVSQRELDTLPKELQSLINKYKGKSGDASLAIVPTEKMLCLKYNNHINYIYPAFSYVILLILDLLKAKTISLTGDEAMAMNLISMLIPIDDTSDDHLRLTDPVISQFALGAQELIPPNNAIIPTPMKLEVLDMGKNSTTDRNVIQKSISALAEETGMPSFGSANNASEIKRAIENASSKVFLLLDQISNLINLKLNIEGYNNNSSYRFEYKLLHMTTFNEIETQDNLLKQSQSGAINKFKLAASYGLSPDAVIGQSYLENTVFRNIWDNLVVPPTSHTQSDGGRPSNESKGVDLSPSGEQTQTIGGNDKEKRDI